MVMSHGPFLALIGLPCKDCNIIADLIKIVSTVSVFSFSTIPHATPTDDGGGEALGYVNTKRDWVDNDDNMTHRSSQFRASRGF